MVRIENKNYDGLIIDTIFHLKKRKVIFEKSCSSLLLIIILYVY